MASGRQGEDGGRVREGHIIFAAGTPCVVVARLREEDGGADDFDALS